jgi:hypothetical protein
MVLCQQNLAVADVALEQGSLAVNQRVPTHEEETLLEDLRSRAGHTQYQFTSMSVFISS